MIIVEHPTEFHVKIGFGRFRNYHSNMIKKLDGSRYDWTRKVFIVPGRYKDELLEIKDKVRAEWNVFTPQPERYGTPSPMKELDFEIDVYHRDEGYKPRPYQLQGIAQGLHFKKLINGDEQGLGKTMQSISTLYAADKYLNEDVWPCLVICPASTKINWAREWEIWTGKKAMVLDDKVKNTWHRFFELGMHDVFITNYESLKKFFVKKMPAKGQFRSDAIEMDPRADLFKSIIIDEIQRCKSVSTQQSKITMRIAHGKEWRIGLTGTPVVNKPIDLLPQLGIIGVLKSAKKFKERYCAGGLGASNLKELNYKLQETCFFRREKKEVAKDLPDKQRQTILCDITTRREYNRAKDDFTAFLEEKGCTDKEIARKMRGEIMVKMGELKRISALGKLNEVKDFIDDVVGSGEKLIVFCTLHAIVDELLKAYPKAVTVTGRDNTEQKQRNIDAFQTNPDVKLIICNIKAAGVGITLTASSRVAFVEYPWTYADCVQAEDRAHRIGQKNTVMCTYFLGEKTIDEQLYKMIQEKRHIGNTITGATDKMEMSFVDSVVSLFTEKAS